MRAARRGWVASRLLFLALALVACRETPGRSGDSVLELEVAVSPTPASTNDTRVVATVRDAGQLAEDVSVVLRAEGTAGPGPVDTLVHREGGRYASSPLSFPAPGEWVLVLVVRTPTGREATFRRPLTVSGPDPGEG